MSNHFATNHVIIFFFILSFLLVHDHDFFPSPSKINKPRSRDSSSSRNCPTTTSPTADTVLVFLSGVFFTVLLMAMVRFPANFTAPIRSGVEILRRIKHRRLRPPPPSLIDGQESPTAIGGGISSSMLKTLPIFVFCAENRPKLGKGAGECAICLSEFLNEQTLRWLPDCDHLFHRDCIDAWFESHTSCPCCRANIERIGGEIVLLPNIANSVGPEIRSSLIRLAGGDGARDLDAESRIGCGGGFIGGLVRVLMGRRRHHSHRIHHR